MLKIHPQFITRVRQASRAEDLHDLVQKAIELEHATIPTYLAAYFTLKLGTNQTVGEIIRSVLVEEMLHMTIAANLLIAIGGDPVINQPGFIPVYPGPLPMNIGDLTVPIAKCSIELVRDVFMKIEEPEDVIPIKTAALDAQAGEFATIGAFYAALDAKLKQLGPAAFKPDRFGREVVSAMWFAPGELFRIVDYPSASAGIQLIVRQGEGTRTSPLDPEEEPAHFYRYQQIVKGKRLVRDPQAPSGFAYAGAPITLDTRNVWNMQSNPPDPKTLPPGSPSRNVSLSFASAYTRLLNALHIAFNGQPDSIDRAIGLMYELRLKAQEVLQTPLDGHPEVSTGLSFTFQPL